LSGQAWEQAQLREVLEAELGPYAGAGGRRLTLSGEPVLLDSTAAVNLTLIVHELATNAGKYGAFAGDGALEVAWTFEPGGRVVLDWRESGGPPASTPTRTGFGSRLIEVLLKGELAGDFTADYRMTGLVARLRFAPSQSDAIV